MKQLSSCLGLLILLATPLQAQNRVRSAERYRVVINHEEQYAVWPAQSKLAEGWKYASEACSLEQCHAYIEEVWTDMRPLSLRKMMEKRGLSREEVRYRIVLNHEEQFSLRLAEQEDEKPWRSLGPVCQWKECMAYIEEVWTDMRPLSVRGK